MKPRRSWWVAYSAGAMVVLLALLWITVTVVRLERAELEARSDATHQEALRLALWRLDSWMAPLLAREAARPYFDYQPFYPQRRAYTALLDPIEPGDVFTASALLGFESEYFSLHFQMAPDGVLTSPQAPSGEFRDLAEDSYLTGAQLVTNARKLDSINNLVTQEQVQLCAAAADETAGEIAQPPPIPSRAPPQEAQQLKSRQEQSKRRTTYLQAIAQQGQADQSDASVVVGGLVPFWSDDGNGDVELIFTRSVRVGDQQYYQGFLCDWPKLRDVLLAQITDLVNDARLVPVLGGAQVGALNGMMLATIPVALEVTAPQPLAAGMLSPARSTLALAWLAVLGGIGAVAVTLRASIAFAMRRARFASAVTHELRTPLTTFRMYSEMLADGMVSDPDQRQTYLETLRDESDRLSTIVENVLAYARLEDGRRPARAVTTTAAKVLDEVMPSLRRRAETADLELRLEGDVDDATSIRVDVEAVGQILFNLVDNACKYAADASERVVHLDVQACDGRLVVGVRDHGPGVPGGVAATIFEAFDRGTRNDGDPTPGVGLGLALARGLARDMGGDLKLMQPAANDGEATGAHFELSLPLR